MLRLEPMSSYDGFLSALSARSLEKTSSLASLLDTSKKENVDVIFDVKSPEEAHPVIHAELAKTPQELRQGLMFRSDIQPGQGMLFQFPDRGRHSMWMKNTPISLDMIFMDKGGVVSSVIEATEPFSERLLSPVKDNDWVLETPTGFSGTYGVVPGTKFTVREQPEIKESSLSKEAIDPELIRRLFTPVMAEDVVSPTIQGIKALSQRSGIFPFLAKQKTKLDDAIYSALLRRQQRSGLSTFLQETGPKEPLLKGAAEFAPGIPEKGRYADIPHVQVPQKWDLSISSHDALRAGSHKDIRLSPSGSEDAFSWAVKKLPEPGKGTYAPLQPTHTRSYLGFQGEIPSGTYGAGTVKLDRLEKVEVTKSAPNEVRFNSYSGRIPEQFVLRQRDGRMWTLHNVTPTRLVKKWEKLIPTDKPSLKSVPFEELDPSRPNEVFQPKVDGAHGIAVLEGGKPVRFFSYREAKTKTGLIEHTHRMPGWWKNVAPEGMKPTVIRGEIYAVNKKGKFIPSASLGGLLNTSVLDSRKKQQDLGVKLHFAAFDVDRHDGKKITSIAPSNTKNILLDISKQVPGIEIMPSAETQKDKERLLRDISEGKHPLTREGIVVRNIDAGGTVKSKLFEDHDVFVREIYSGAKPGEAGGFRFSYTQHGPILGNVGSGFSQKQRKDMNVNSKDWIGRVAKVTAQEKFRSGALRMPVFKQMHESKGPQPYHEIAENE